VPFVAPSNRVDWYTGAVSAAVGVVPFVISPLAVTRDAPKVSAAVAATPLDDEARVCATLVDAEGRLAAAADQYLSEARGPLRADLQQLQCPLRELGRASPDLIGALKLILTQPFDIDTVPKIIRGDYMHVSLELDVTYSGIDNAFLTGTGLSGSLRALEQSFGRDPETMVPDVRYTPNPNDAPGGPLVERADTSQC